MKKLISILLAIILMITMIVPVMADATEKPPKEEATSFVISVPDNGDDTTITISKTKAEENERINFTVEVAKGYTLDSVKVLTQNGEEVELTTTEDGKYEFTMPASDVRIELELGGAKIPYSPVLVEVTGGHGKVNPSCMNAYSGDTVTYTVEPEEGYMIDKHIINDYNTRVVPYTTVIPGEKFSFVMTDFTAVIKMSFKPITEFHDVKPGWYYDAVRYAVRKGYMVGVAENTFGSDYAVARAMLTQILYAAEGRPEASSESNFTDLMNWCVDGVNWCAEKGIVAGYGDGRFGAADSLTREQMAAILYSYSKYKGYDLTADGDLSKFSDKNKISPWAVQAMKWAVGHKLISGTDKGLEPGAVGTRAQLAVIINAYDKQVRK